MYLLHVDANHQEVLLYYPLMLYGCTQQILGVIALSCSGHVRAPGAFGISAVIVASVYMEGLRLDDIRQRDLAGYPLISYSPYAWK